MLCNPIPCTRKKKELRVCLRIDFLPLEGKSSEWWKNSSIKQSSEKKKRKPTLSSEQAYTKGCLLLNGKCATFIPFPLLFANVKKTYFFPLQFENASIVKC